MAKNSNKHRNITIACMAMMMLVLSLIGGTLILFNRFNQLDTIQISLSLQRQLYAFQGYNSHLQVGVSSVGIPQNISLSSEVSLNNITCTFSPATGLSNFTSTLNLYVPDSTPTGNYTVTVFASGGGQITNASSVLSVMNTKIVTVSGVASCATLRNSSLLILCGIRFIDIQTGTDTYVDRIGYYPFDINSPDYPYVLVNYPLKHYSAELVNEQTYNVALSYYCGTQGNMSLVEDFIGNFTVHTATGQTVIHKNFP